MAIGSVSLTAGTGSVSVSARNNNSQAQSMRCPLLLSHLETRNPGRRLAVADAARASPRSLTAYQGLRGRFIFLGVAEAAGTPTGEALLAALEGGLRHYTDEPLDLVLLWDLPNYVSAEGLPTVAATIRPYLRPGGRLHLLVANSQREIAQHPGHFELAPDWSAVEAEFDTETRPAPRFSPWQVERACTGFEVERSVLLRSGMQEYLLRLRMRSPVSDDET